MTYESEQTEVAVIVEIDADTCVEAAATALAGPSTRRVNPNHPICL